MFEIGHLIEDQFLVLEICRGRHWIVYVVYDNLSEKVFIIKRPSESFHSNAFETEIFIKKAKIWIDLGEYDEIATAYMIKEFEGIPHLFIDYVDGPSLADILCSRSGKPLPIDQTMALMTELINGMKFLERASFYTGETGVIHGNLTPCNILTTSGNAKITDIGIANALRFPVDASHTAFLFEKIPYIAPEQLEDLTVQNQYTDIYSFGAIMYEVATGTQPNRTTEKVDSLNIIVTSDPVPPRMRNRTCPRWLEETILKCMAQKPENRFRSFEQIETLVTEMMKTETMQESPEDRPKASTSSSRVARIRGVAKKESSRLNQYYLGVEHLMLALLEEEENIILSTLGDKVSSEKLRSEILSQFPKGEGPWNWNGVRKTPRYKMVMKMARQIQRAFADERMLPQHILLAILEEGNNMPVRVLNNLEIDVEGATEKLHKELSRRRPSILVTEPDNPAPRFIHKVSSTSHGLYFIPFIGRTSELRSAQNLLLNERTSIMIVGEPGAGKTAFVQKLACMISETAVEAGIDYGSMYKLRTPVLLLSTDKEEDLENNFIAVLDEIIASKSIILIENLALLLRLSADKHSRLADLLDEYISSKGLLMVATATFESRSLCETKHGNIMQFLETINLEEPSDKETLEILRGARKSLEIEHSVIINNDALTAVMNLSEKLQTSRALPAKAFELLDQACMTAKLNADTDEKSDLQIIVAAEQVKEVMTRSFQSKRQCKEATPEAYS